VGYCSPIRSKHDAEWCGGFQLLWHKLGPVCWC
jgi:hypothetical protein